jgi:ubiquinone/menaquinone biosynthesis C-methylase UbiE
MSSVETVSNDEIIRKHYKTMAEKHKDSALSTMEDPIIREKEVEIINNFLRLPAIQQNSKEVLEIGSGNGYTISLLHKSFPDYQFTGMDFSDDLLQIAKERNLDRVVFEQGDARNLRFDNESFDIIYTERCIINLLNWEEQQQALKEMHRVLRKGGYMLFIEAFTDGYQNLNKARNELGLDSIPMPHHNLFFEKEKFEPFVSELFEIVDPVSLGAASENEVHRNFLSSHFFTARVLHPLLTKGDPFMKNTEFVKFFTILPPIGCYASIQAYLLRKRG